MSALWVSEVLLYYFKCVYSWKSTGKGLWNLSHVTMGANFKARRRHAQYPRSSITQGTSCVTQQGGVQRFFKHTTCERDREKASNV